MDKQINRWMVGTWWLDKWCLGRQMSRWLVEGEQMKQWMTGWVGEWMNG